MEEKRSSLTTNGRTTMSLAQLSQANWGGVQPNPCNSTKLNHMPAHSSIIVCYVLADGPHPSPSFSTPKFRQFTALCNSCRTAAYAHAVVDVYAVIISAFATLVGYHSSAESSSGSNQYRGRGKM
ncbi:hypothetical protein DAPPUDRAFT_248252 [Daphnia pulex]|uniref:Uncharacterized protein n=1 Tax=Daphnia pulex TaxID=6669 RepID=E9GU04_DAPPU|nr:hypothetical protein DAPPUDRAFT_248252 [Daphnia pulex]|eukprot:EFX77056.1 hypothetical protein DAPPUDRAFT_248252 [Daphnia pulex]